MDGATERSAAAALPTAPPPLSGRSARLLAAERPTDADPHGEKGQGYDVAEARTAAGRRRLGLGGTHGDS
ncbi:hypothetical protein [Streptodolium elevatio]